MLENETPGYSMEIAEKYKEIVNIYDKNGAPMIAIEACFRVSNYLLKHKRKIFAADFLNEAFRISRKVIEEQKVNMISFSFFSFLFFSFKFFFKISIENSSFKSFNSIL